MSRRTRDPAAKQAALVAAAAEAFTTHGFAAASTGRIADDAGVSEGIVFHHFGSKHGLLQATTRMETTAFMASMGELDEDGAIDWERALDRTFDWVAGHAMVSRLWSENDDRVIGSLRRGLQEAVVARFTVLLEREQEAGRCRSGDARWFAELQFAVVGEALITHFSDPDRLPRDVAIAEAARVVRAIVSP